MESGTRTEELPAFPMSREDPFHPPSIYRELCSDRPISKAVMPNGEQIWLIASHEYARQILTDPRVSADRTKPGFPVIMGIPNRQVMQEFARKIPAILGMDPPEHTAHRRMALPDFTVRQIKSLTGSIERIVDEYISTMLAGERPVDVVQALSIPVPTKVICELLGIPYADREFFAERTRTLVRRDCTAHEKRTAGAELSGYIEELIIRAENNPGERLIDRITQRYVNSGAYSRKHVVGMVTVLLNGGQETTANMISLGVVALLENASQLAEIQRDQSLIPKATEELLRFFSVATETTGYRTALEDIEIGGVIIRAQEGILVLGGAANRDQKVFTDPDKFDIHRDSSHHLAFGYGVHQCIGQHLTRLELNIVFQKLFSRVPNLRLTVPARQLNYKSDAGPYGIYDVPVTW